MALTRVDCIVEVLGELDVGVWRKTRYANNTGTCLWCTTDELIMVPDDETAALFAQGKGEPEALMAALETKLPERLAQRSDPAEGSAGEIAALGEAPTVQAALNAAVDAILAEGERRGLERARGILATAVASHFGPLPPMVSQRIAHGEYADLERWAQRLGQVPSAFMVVS
jgi:hypothetical protein